MKKVLSVKGWMLRKKPQFKMTGEGRAERLSDKYAFSNLGDILSVITYEGRRGIILEFMADYVHVQIEVVKSGVLYYNGIEFETIEVPINDLSRRISFTDKYGQSKDKAYNGKGESRNK